ncbi:MAG TPA: extracellular solute-binding protein [Jatrophihabitans sp.]|jgi:multiple sugar transport system substrate-binding protein|uniref:ABC transporter substrate-binding protein n=1 Tax=Jatrophihabitans sp. TaxID=1932789 RepID=UPI002F147B57
MKPQAFVAAAAIVLGVTSIVACSSSESSTGKDGAKQLTVWSEENDADRVKATQALAAKFTAATGVNVKIVGIDEQQFQQLITSGAAAGKLPDVIGALPLAGVQYMASNDLVNTDAAQQVLQNLDTKTFNANAVSLTQYKGKQAAVPSDAWVQMLIYRKDLFDKAGLAAPSSFAAIQTAAQKLNSPQLAGISMATVPNDSFTQQSFEYFALANGCQMVDDSGKITLDSPACVDTFTTYSDLIKNTSVRGNQDVDTTRATYLAGKSAMFVWSSFVLDEMAGLRDDALPTCPECKSDPAFLAKNSGIVTSLQGAGQAKPAQFGEIGSWTITKSANAEAAGKFVEFMLNDGYQGWLGLSPEGKFPVRQGSSAEPKKFVDAWAALQTGVDRKAPLSQFYPRDVLDALKNSPAAIARWALPQGQGALLGATLGPLPVPKAVNAAANGGVSGEQAAKQAQQAVQKLQSSLK